MLVGFQAAVERIKLGIAAECGRIQSRSLGIALALGLLRGAVGFGQNHLALPVGIGLDLFAFRRAGSAQFIRHTLAFGIHAAIDRLADFQRKIDAFQAHIQHLDADLARIGIGLGAQHCHDLVAFAGHHFVDSALAEFFAHAGIDRLQQTRPGAYLVSAHADVILLHIHDAPLDERIHQHILLFRSNEALRIHGIQRENARIKIAHVLHQRHLEIQAGIGFDADHFAQLKHNRILALIHHKHAHAQQNQRGNRADQYIANTLVH